MVLTRPNWTAGVSPNPNPQKIHKVTWWFWCRLKELEPTTQLGGIFADKPHFHQTGNANKAKWPKSYSIADKINQHGQGMIFASALDWTFPEAQRGDYTRISKYTSRVLKSAVDSTDPRLDLCLFEIFGQSDTDRTVEGYDEFHEDSETSDDSHLWHIHFSFIRSLLGNYWGAWALLTVLMGWTTQKWRESLPLGDPNYRSPSKPPITQPPGTHKPGSRRLLLVNPPLSGEDVTFVQKWIGEKRAGKADGVFGAKTAEGVKWYQRLRGLTPDGIVGPKTWEQMGVKSTA